MSSLLAELKTIMDTLKVPNEIGIFKAQPAPDQFVVFVPLSDETQNADDRPDNEVQAVRISLFSKSNYRTLARSIADAVLDADIVITERRYIGHEDETGYHHYAIDVEKNYLWEE